MIWRLRITIVDVCFAATLLLCGCWRADEIVETAQGPIRVYNTTKRLDPLAKTFVPAEATNIRLHYSSSFGGQSYSISCHVIRGDFDEFVRERDFSVVPYVVGKELPFLLRMYRKDDPVLCDAPDLNGGEIVNHHVEGYFWGGGGIRWPTCIFPI